MAKMSFTGNRRTNPVWMADWAGREHLEVFPAKLVASAFTNAAGVAVTLTAGAAGAATSIAVTALAYPAPASTITIALGNVIIPAGSLLDFGGAKFARTTADALVGATTISVAALPTALVTGDVAYWNQYQLSFVPSGTLVGRTYTERNAGTGFGPADLTNDDEIYLTAFDVVDLQINNDVELYRHTARVYENYLPNYAVNAAAASEVQTITISGTPTGGTFIVRFKGSSTTAVAYNATGSTLDTALEALATIGAGNVAATGSAGGPYTLTFGGTLADLSQPLVEVDTGGLTGGTPSAAVVRTTAGQQYLKTIRSLYQCMKATN